jgi:hypothetical protein
MTAMSKCGSLATESVSNRLTYRQLLLVSGSIFLYSVARLGISTSRRISNEFITGKSHAIEVSHLLEFPLRKTTSLSLGY